MKKFINHYSFFLTLFFVMVGIFVFFPPFYGLMDDLNYLTTAAKIQKIGIWNHYSEWLPQDFAMSGRLRPFLPLMIVGFYGSTLGSSLLLHLTNAIFCFLVFLLLAKTLADLYSRLFGELNLTRNTLFLFIFLFTLAQPWTRLLFSLPALQEKIVLLAGALSIAIVLSDFYRRKSFFLRWFLLSVCIFLGCFTREQFVLFFPAILAAIIIGEENEKNGFRFAVFAVLPVMVGLVISIWLLGQGSSYKERFGLLSFWETVKNSKSLWLFLIIAFTSMLPIVFSSTKVSWIKKLCRLFPSFSVLGFLAMMAPWGLGGYLNVVVTPFVTLCALNLASPVLNRPFPTGFTRSVQLMLAALFLCFLFIDVSTKWDLGRLLGSPQLKELSAQNQIIYAPCEEGADHLKAYPKLYFGYDIQVGRIPVFQEVIKRENESYWIVGKHLSCWPTDFDPTDLIKSGMAEVLWQGTHQLSHYLLKIKHPK
jgi:hypothetical protein